MQSEEWRPVVGYQDWYSVSNIGRVRRDMAGTRTKPGRLLKSWVEQNGYVRVGLSRGTHQSLRFHFVHKLVAEAFIGARPDGHGINHLNGDKTDNRPANLEWSTPKRNSEHAVQTGLMPNGDRSSRRLHPDHYPRGDEHHTRRDPDSVQRGVRNGMSKLDEDAVRDILTSPLAGVALAEKYGVGTSLISQVRRRQIWRHVTI